MCSLARVGPRGGAAPPQAGGGAGGGDGGAHGDAGAVLSPRPRRPEDSAPARGDGRPLRPGSAGDSGTRGAAPCGAARPLPGTTWNAPRREAGESPTLGVFKGGLDVALRAVLYLTCGGSVVGWAR